MVGLEGWVQLLEGLLRLLLTSWHCEGGESPQCESLPSGTDTRRGFHWSALSPRNYGNPYLVGEAHKRGEAESSRVRNGIDRQLDTVIDSATAAPGECVKLDSPRAKLTVSLKRSGLAGSFHLSNTHPLVCLSLHSWQNR